MDHSAWLEHVGGWHDSDSYDAQSNLRRGIRQRASAGIEPE